MAVLCPIDGCRGKQGLCIHDKLMLVLGALGVAGVIAHFGLGLL